MGEINDRVIERACEGLEERATARGAGLIELYRIHGAILDADALHVLTTDIEDTVNLWLEERGRVVVRDGFHLPLIQLEGRL